MCNWIKRKDHVLIFVQDNWQFLSNVRMGDVCFRHLAFHSIPEIHMFNHVKLLQISVLLNVRKCVRNSMHCYLN